MKSHLNTFIDTIWFSGYNPINPKQFEKREVKNVSNLIFLSEIGKLTPKNIETSFNPLQFS